MRVDGHPVARPSDEVDAQAEIAAQAEHPFVSRGALKLEGALEAFAIDPTGCVALDVGASTGGFTELLLQRGARHVYAVDVGRDQFHARLRGRADITLLEGTDARSLTRDLVSRTGRSRGGGCELHLPLAGSARRAGAGRAARAPRHSRQAAVRGGRQRVKKGIVRDAAVHDEVCARIAAEVTGLGWQVTGLIPSPIAGGDGNREFLMAAERG